MTRVGADRKKMDAPAVRKEAGDESSRVERQKCDEGDWRCRRIDRAASVFKGNGTVKVWCER